MSNDKWKIRTFSRWKLFDINGKTISLSLFVIVLHNILWCWCLLERAQRLIHYWLNSCNCMCIYLYSLVVHFSNRIKYHQSVSSWFQRTSILRFHCQLSIVINISHKTNLLALKVFLRLKLQKSTKTPFFKITNSENKFKIHIWKCLPPKIYLKNSKNKQSQILYLNVDKIPV